MAKDSFDPAVFLKDGVPSKKGIAPSPGKSRDHSVVEAARSKQKARQKEMAKTKGAKPAGSDSFPKSFG